MPPFPFRWTWGARGKGQQSWRFVSASRPFADPLLRRSPKALRLALGRWAMRIASPGHAVFALMMLAVGLVGFIEGKFAPIWAPVAHALPGREVLLYLCATVALLGGVGLLVRRTSSIAAHILFAYLLVWMLVFKAPFIVRAPLEEGSYQSIGENAVGVAAAWVLVTWFAPDAEKQRLGLLAGDLGLRLARTLYGLALIAFGFSHFFYVNLTTP